MRGQSKNLSLGAMTTIKLGNKTVQVDVCLIFYIKEENSNKRHYHD